LNGLPACTDLTTKPGIIDAGFDLLNRPFVANDTVATAGACISSQFLACWVIAKKRFGKPLNPRFIALRQSGEKEATVDRWRAVVEHFIDL
jgi:hypothetical protein